MSHALAVFRTNSLGEAFELANSLAGKAEILEVSPMGKSALVLLKGPSDVFSKLDWKQLGDRAVLIENPDEGLFPAYLSYDNAKIDQCLLVFETSEPAQIFKAAQEGLKLGMQVVDFRILRTEGSPCYLMMTADAPKDLSQFKYVKVAAIDQPGTQLRAFLDVTPQ